MTYPDFLNNAPVQKAAEAFVARYGGRFACDEPGDRLMYVSADGEAVHTPPDGATPEQVLKDLQSGKQLTELWPELEYDPAIDY